MYQIKMDNTDSEIIESLNILRPPVTRDYNSSLFGYNPNAINFMSEWRKPKKRLKGGKRIRRSVESSTSLILKKKTSDRQIFDRYPVVSYTSIQRQQAAPSLVKYDEKDKPLIKVIVVPNDQPSEGKQSGKNKVHKPIYDPSEDDNTIETKNVYLVVTGGKKDKIYEIKTTDSPTLSTTESKDETVSKFFNGDCFKQLIKALNMERKKTCQIATEDLVVDHLCKCTGCIRQPFNIDRTTQEIERNKVKIFGQLGLTEDDRYILKCSATVDDKPVPTTFSTVGQKVPNDLEAPKQMQTNFRPYKEGNIQVNANIPPSKNVYECFPDNECFPDKRRTIQSQCCRPLECQTENEMPPRRTQQSLCCSRPVECPPGNDKAPCRTKQLQCCSKPVESPLEKEKAPCKTKQLHCCGRSIKCPTENDVSPRRTQQSRRRTIDYPLENDMSPGRTHQSQRRTIEYPPGNDMVPRRTQQTQRRIDKYPPENDMAPRKTQQTQRRMDEYPPENYMAPRRTQQTQRRMDEYPPENDMAPRRTQKTQRRMDEYPHESDIAPRRTQQAQQKMDEYPPENDMAPRRTQQTQQRMDEYPPENDMAPRRTQQAQQKMDEYPPENDMAPRRTQQTQRRINEYPPENDMAPRRTQQTHRTMDKSLSPNNLMPRRTQLTQRRMDEYTPENYMSQRRSYESQCKTVPCPANNPHECCRGGRDLDQVSSGGMRLSSPRNSPTGSVEMDALQGRQSSPRSTILGQPLTRYSHESQATQTNWKTIENDNYGDYYSNNDLPRNPRKSRPSTKDNNTQCACTCGDKNANACKMTETQSPLVIISVYPNAEIECEPGSVSRHVEANFYGTSPVAFSGAQRLSSPKQDKPKKDSSIAAALKDTVLQENQGRRAFIHKSYRVPNRSLPPQNVKNKKVNDQNTVIKTILVTTNASSQSPAKIPHTNKNPIRSNTCKTIKKQESKKTTVSKQKYTTATKSSRNMQLSKNKCKPRSKDKCGGGNQMKSKTFVADKYKKAINDRIDKYNRTSPKHNVSKISINIDSENECYDVSYYQGKYMTDLLIHKTSKNWKNLNDSSVKFVPESKIPMMTEFQAYSVSETENFPDNDVPIDEATSKLNPRDSLEISHRHNLRTEIETQTLLEQTDTVSKTDMHYFAPVKHFTGDDCVICDPLERDKEIQHLLGVSRRVISSQTTDLQKPMFGNRTYITQHYYSSDERECKDVLSSNVEFVDSLCSCCCLRRSNCENFNKINVTKGKCKKSTKSTIRKLKQNTSLFHAKKQSKYFEREKNCEKHQITNPPPIEMNLSCCSDPPKPKKQVEKTKNPLPQKPPASPYQPLILNRNVHVFLQVEQFCKQKSIVLTKKQYEKVKNTIKRTLSKNNKQSCRKRDYCEKGVESLISIGEVRQKTNKPQRRSDDIDKCYVTTIESFCGVKPAPPPPTMSCSKCSKKSWLPRKGRSREKKTKNKEQVETVLLYSRDNENCEPGNFKIGARQTMSSIEVRYASVAFSKHIKFSAADAFKPYFEPLPSESSLALKDPISIEMLFEGHKKCPTPNLGTSTLTCMSEPSYLASPKLFDKPNQAKRPFLKRLMSCLVMRSEKTPMPPLMPPKYPPTVDSSFDSYHFSTSLGAIEMSSSMYDTSASFFSNHSVCQKDNKMKRGFLNSMRGFLHNKRS